MKWLGWLLLEDMGPVRPPQPPLYARDRLCALSLMWTSPLAAQENVLNTSKYFHDQWYAGKCLTLQEVKGSHLSISYTMADFKLAMWTQQLGKYLKIFKWALCPSWFGSVVTVSTQRLKGPELDSNQGHIHWFQAQSLAQVGDHKRGNQLCLSPSCPLSLKINEGLSAIKITKKINGEKILRWELMKKIFKLWFSSFMRD